MKIPEIQLQQLQQESMELNADREGLGSEYY